MNRIAFQANLKEETGKPVITSMNLIDFAKLISDVISNVEEKNEK